MELAATSHQPCTAPPYVVNLLCHFEKSDLAVLQHSFVPIFQNSSHLHQPMTARDEVGEKLRLEVPVQVEIGFGKSWYEAH